MHKNTRRLNKFYWLKPEKTATPIIGNLIALLNLTKVRIEETVQALNKGELDYILDVNTPTVGTLLKHMIFIEDAVQKKTLLGRELQTDELEFWYGSMTGQLLARVVHGNTLKEYLDLWRTVRTDTVNLLIKCDDNWLYNDQFGVNNYFMVFHIIEDQLGHLGQIKSILRKIRVASGFSKPEIVETTLNRK